MSIHLSDTETSYSEKPWDDASNLYLFPFRNYSPAAARWTTRDPLGMVDGPNAFAYAKGRPTMEVDQMGLSIQSTFNFRSRQHVCGCGKLFYFWDFYGYKDRGACVTAYYDAMLKLGKVQEMEIYYDDLKVEVRSAQAWWGAASTLLSLGPQGAAIGRLKEPLRGAGVILLAISIDYDGRLTAKQLSERAVRKQMKSMCGSGVCRGVESYQGCQYLGQIVPRR